MKKVLFFSMMCLMAAVTITSCDKDSTGTGTNGGGGITPAGYVDLELPSGTKWKAANETNPNDNDFYSCDEAVEKFGSSLPTKEQFDELRTCCFWTWDEAKKGYKVVGPNGKSIFLPAAGYRNCNGYVGSVGSHGVYWSSTPDGSGYAWGLYFNSGVVSVNNSDRCLGRSVRLVQD